MFGSNHDGERASAAAKADTLVRERGLSWRDLLAPKARTKKKRWRAPEIIEEKLAALRESETDYPGALNDWELEFVISVSRYADTLTEKQERLVDTLIYKLRDHITRRAR